LQSDAGWEEYYDYIFPSDEASQSNLKLLEMAKRWKKQTVETTEPSESDAAAEGDNLPMETSSTQPEESAAETTAVDSREEKLREGDSDTDISDSGESDSDAD